MSDVLSDSLAAFVERNAIIGFNGQKFQNPQRPAAAAPLAPSGIAQSLNVLFKWDGARAYQYFLLELPAKIDFPTMLGNDYANIRALNGKQQPFAPFLNVKLADGTSPSIGVSIPPSMITPNIAPTDQFCVGLDGFVNVTLPVAGAQIVSSAFVAGLVVRLLLSEFSKKKNLKLPIPNYRNKVESGNWTNPRPPKPEVFAFTVRADCHFERRDRRL